jgi:putative PIN family toxin of toxin-antitoxin system
MQRIIIDTNILISALISKGIPSLIIDRLIIENKVKLCLSNDIFIEYLEVISREKFSKYRNFKIKADLVIGLLEDISLKFNPIYKIDELIDKSDNKFLELAVESNADFLITGNVKDFTIDKIKKTRIVTPSEYWNKYNPELKH